MVVDVDGPVQVLDTELRKIGFDVISFTDTCQALSHLANSRHNIDLVVAGTRMSGMNVFQFSRRIRELQPSIRIIAVSGIEMNRREFDMLLPKAGIDGFLIKPFGTAELLEMAKY